MSILDKLGIKKAKEQKPAEEKKVAPQVEPKADVRVTKIAANMAHQILLRPILSEKGTGLANSGRYVFAVHRKANKSEIKKSIQAIYQITVEDVRIVNLPSKTRRYGRTVGETSPWKKAIVTVKSGERIPGIIESVG